MEPSPVSQHTETATALGRSLWSTDLFLPSYRTGEIGDWRIHSGGQLVNDWGYYTGSTLLEMLPFLARRVQSRAGADAGVDLGADSGRDGWEIWMSLTPHEIESRNSAAAMPMAMW